MLTDSTLQFSSAQAITATAVSTNVVDTGALQDLGIGVRHLQLAIYVGTAFSTLTTLNVQLQGATTAGGTYYTIVETGTIPVANLVANAKIPLDLTHRGQQDPTTDGRPKLHRFLQLNYVVAGSAETTGTISFAGIVIDRDENSMPQYPSGYTVGA